MVLSFDMLIQAVVSLLEPGKFLLIFVSVCMGIIGGALPGISATMTVALLVSLTYGMSPINGILVLVAAYSGAIFGGSISATLINVPGTPANAATCLEGYPLTQKGEAGKALGVNCVQSWIGGLLGALLFLFTTPLMAKFALKFGPWEYFWFALFGVFIAANLASGSLLKGLIVGALGFSISTIGLDPIYGDERLTFGIFQLKGGIELIPAMIGLFGMSEILDILTQKKTKTILRQSTAVIPNLRFILKHAWLTIRVTVFGFIIGVIPGTGPDIASWVGYDYSKRVSKHKELFGKGNYEGLVGSETANNACTGGVFVPLLAIAIPGDAVTAVILGALIMHGVLVGPTLLVETPQWYYMIFVALLFANTMFLGLGLVTAKIFQNVLKASQTVIMSIVTVLCVIGAYTMNNRMFDVSVMFGFGIFGLIMKKLGFPMAPMVLGIVLGERILDTEFRRAILLSKGSFYPFISRPVSFVLILILLYIVGSNHYRSYKASKVSAD
jgi:putative tricarboxylic transport membrane protein